MNAPPGFTSRPLARSDAAAAAALVNEFDSAFLEDPDVTSAGEVEGWWTRLRLPTDSLGFFGANGRLAACATVYERHQSVFDLDAYVSPRRLGLGLGGALVDWAEEKARTRGDEVLRAGALAADEPAKRLLATRGFQPIRHFYRMLIDLHEPPPEPGWPSGFTVSTFAAGEEELLHATIEEAFADHWGYEPRDLEHWRTSMFGQEWWDPSLVHLVREGGEVVAAEVNALRFGIGWVGTLATRRPWRGKGLGRALLLLAFGELYRRGERRIGLGVDAENETGATHLYESVGMRVAWQADVYEKRL